MQGLTLNEIHQGDCLELMKEIPDGSINMILCDLPYGTTRNKWDSVIPFAPLWEQYERIITSHGAIVLTASQPFTSALVMSNPRLFKYEWIWVKSKAFDFMNAKQRPMKKHESILVFGRGNSNSTPGNKRMNYNPQGLKPLNKLVDGRHNNKADAVGHRLARPSLKMHIQEWTNYPNSVLHFPSEGKNIHPTQKPVALFEYLVRTYTNENDLVLDNAAGSSTTAVACINTNRNWICIEKDEKYCRMGRQRLKQFSMHN